MTQPRARTLGAALSTLSDFITPEVLVLGGGLFEALPKIMRQDIRKSLKAHAAPESYRGLKVENAALGDYAVAAGAACLALERQTSTKRGRAARKK